MYSLPTLISFAATAVNVAFSLVCGLLLLSHHKDMHDRSRLYLAILAFSMVPAFSLRLVSQLFHPDVHLVTEVISASKVYNGVLFLTLLILYPVEVMRPRWLNAKRLLRLFTPFIVFTLPALFIPTTRLYSLSELWAHVGEFNVWWRLLSMLATVVMYYVFLLRLPFNWRYSSADRRWVRRYALIMTPIGICFYIISFVFYLPVHMIHTLWIPGFICYYTYYEFFLRLMPTEVSTMEEREETAEAVVEETAPPTSNKAPLFLLMDKKIDEERLFCNPDFGRSELCQLANCNHAEMATLIKQNTDAPNSQVYINRKRIAYAARLLREYPNYTIEAVAFDAGFRTKVTFHRLFKEAYGITPSEYREQ